MSRLRFVFFACVSVLLAGFCPADTSTGLLDKEVQQQVQVLLDQSQDTEETFQAAMVARWEAFKSWLNLSADRQMLEPSDLVDPANNQKRDNCLRLLSAILDNDPSPELRACFDVAVERMLREAFFGLSRPSTIDRVFALWSRILTMLNLVANGLAPTTA